MNENTSSSPRFYIQASGSTWPIKKLSAGHLDDWTSRVLTDRRLTRKAVTVGIFLRDQLDSERGFAAQPIRTIAKSIGIARSSAERAIRALEQIGYVRIVHGRAGEGNLYQLKLTGGLS